MMLRGLRTASSRSLPAFRTNTSLAGCVQYRIDYHDAGAIALVAPHEKVKLDYSQLMRNIEGVAGGLKALGYNKGDVFATDVAETTVANVTLQCAASYHGIQFLTVCNDQDLQKLLPMIPLQGAVMSTKDSFLSKSQVTNKNVMADLKGKNLEGITTRTLDLAYYNSPELVNNRFVYLSGVAAAGLLEIKQSDTICIATSTNHMLGMGSVVAGFVRNATVYLPDMANLDLGDATLVVTDSHNIAKVRAAAKKGSKLRGGIVINGDSGAEIPMLMNETEDVEGVALRVLQPDGHPSQIMRPFVDACKDTYYSFK